MTKTEAPNAARGERSLTIGGETVIVCATMDGMARLSAALGFPPLGEMLRRLTGGEINAVRGAIEHLAIRGDGAAAALAATMTDILEATPAITDALLAHIGDDKPGKPDAGTTT